MVLPILTYGSQCYTLTVTTMKQYEMIQKRFCEWSLPHVSYKEALLLLNILPIPMYMQIIDILFMSKLNSNYYDYYIQDLPNITTDGYLRQKLFHFLQRPRNVKCENNYLYRTPRLIQNIPHCVNFLEPIGLKQRLLTWTWTQFHSKYDEMNTCSWKL